MSDSEQSAADATLLRLEMSRRYGSPCTLCPREIVAVLDEVAMLRRMIAGMASRIANQSELLTRRAEKAHDDRAIARVGDEEGNPCDGNPATKGGVLAGDRTVIIMADGRCGCDCATTCPLGKTGSATRCTRAELEAKGFAHG